MSVKDDVLAILMDKHDTIGVDAVAMCVNDIICCGAKPLFFLDYIACGKNIPEKIASIVSGVCEGCVQSSALYAAYAKWAESNNEYKMSHTKFSAEVSKKFEKISTRQGKFFNGLSLC